MSSRAAPTARPTWIDLTDRHADAGGRGVGAFAGGCEGGDGGTPVLGGSSFQVPPQPDTATEIASTKTAARITARSCASLRNGGTPRPSRRFRRLPAPLTPVSA